MTASEKNRIMKAIAAEKRRVNASPEAARKFLEETGIYKTDGSLADEYKAPSAA
jgi:hypothetical protein